MPQQPNPISLMLCDQVLFERGTQKPILVGVFTGIAAVGFPTEPQRIDAFVVLTDGQGDVTIRLSVVHLDTDQEIYVQPITVSFTDPLQVVNLRMRLRRLSFPAAGSYLFALSAGDVEIATRRVSVYLTGGSP